MMTLILNMVNLSSQPNPHSQPCMSYCHATTPQQDFPGQPRRSHQRETVPVGPQPSAAAAAWHRRRRRPPGGARRPGSSVPRHHGTAAAVRRGRRGALRQQRQPLAAAGEPGEYRHRRSPHPDRGPTWIDRHDGRQDGEEVRASATHVIPQSPMGKSIMLPAPALLPLWTDPPACQATLPS